MDFMNLKKEDREISDLMEKELKRQREGIELIASENFASQAVMEAMGSHLTNKYAEGYPSKRYYGGCEIVDEVEEIARNRAKKLFGAEHVNVQPHSGSQANMAVYFTILEPGDTVLGMDLSHGGHLTHGSPVNFSGKLFNFVSYGVDSETERINYDNVRELALKHKPKLIVAGASAYSRVIDFEKFKEICDEVGAYFMVDMAHIAGLVAAGEHPSPVPYADFVTSTTHKTLRGPRGGLILCKEKYAKALDKNIFPGMQGGPLMHVIAAKAQCFYEALDPSFVTYQEQVLKNIKALSDYLISKGMIVISGGTDNHLILLDVYNSLGITGKEAEEILDSVHITVNKNTIPNETLSPMKASGIRIGSPAMTTRGLKEEDFITIGDIIYNVLNNYNNERALDREKKRVLSLTNKYKMYN